MPSLQDSLASLSSLSSHITSLSLANSAPAGPYTVSYLKSCEDIFTSIREAGPHERGLFTFIGEAKTGNGVTGTVKTAEESTPLKRLERAKGLGKGKGKERENGVWSDAELLLRTALELVDQ